MEKVILLPTNKEPKVGQILRRECFGELTLWRYKETYEYANAKVYRTLCGSFEDYYKIMVPHEMYVLSDEKIIEGDWFLINSQVLRCIELSQYEIKSIDDYYWDKKSCKKIVQTTNAEIDLPRPSEEFIEEYVKVVNEAKKTLSIETKDWNDIYYDFVESFEESKQDFLDDIDFKIWLSNNYQVPKKKWKNTK